MGGGSKGGTGLYCIANVCTALYGGQRTVIHGLSLKRQF